MSKMVAGIAMVAAAISLLVIGLAIAAISWLIRFDESDQD